MEKDPILEQFVMADEEVGYLDSARRGVAEGLRKNLMPVSAAVKDLYPHTSDFVARLVGSNTGEQVFRAGSSNIEAIRRDEGTNLVTHLGSAGGVTFIFTPSTRDETDDGYEREVNLSTVSVAVLPSNGLSGNEYRLDGKLATLTLSTLSDRQIHGARLAAVRESARRMLVQEKSGQEIASLTESRTAIAERRERIFANLKRIMEEIRAGK